MLNKVFLIGRLGKDPETRYTSGGSAVCNFSIATDETFKDRSGQKQKHIEWHKIIAWSKLAEICQQYLKKGSLVYVEGKIQSRQWEDKRSGEKRTAFEIVASTMKMLGDKPERTAAPAQDHYDADPVGGGGGSEISDEDIPF